MALQGNSGPARSTGEPPVWSLRYYGVSPMGSAAHGRHTVVSQGIYRHHTGISSLSRQCQMVSENPRLIGLIQCGAGTYSDLPEGGGLARYPGGSIEMAVVRIWPPAAD